ncbi:MAG: type II CAAX endopeptidase family protein [Pseudomonadota bacterium]
MAYSALDKFTAPAQRSAALWQTILGVILAAVIYGVGAWAVLYAAQAFFQLPVDGGSALAAPLVLVLLFQFVFMALAVALVTRFFHRRPVSSIFGDLNRLLPDFLRMAALALAMSVVATALAVLILDIEWRDVTGAWIIMALAAIPLLLIQTGAEEMVFRGYLLQQLGARFSAKAWIAWLLLPSVIFGAAHVGPHVTGVNLAAVLAITTLFGIIAADMTARTGSLGAAWGFHFVNNVQALLVITLAGPLSGLGLGQIAMDANDPSALPLYLANALGLIVLYLLWRRFHG